MSGSTTERGVFPHSETGSIFVGGGGGGGGDIRDETGGEVGECEIWKLEFGNDL